jgi:hypothetical protein
MPSPNRGLPASDRKPGHNGNFPEPPGSNFPFVPIAEPRPAMIL